MSTHGVVRIARVRPGATDNTGGSTALENKEAALERDAIGVISQAAGNSSSVLLVSERWRQDELYHGSTVDDKNSDRCCRKVEINLWTETVVVEIDASSSKRSARCHCD